jgi:hypothetical protein
VSPQPNSQYTQQGDILTPATIANLEVEIASCVEQITSLTFPADPLERETAILMHVELQSRMRAYQALIAASYEATTPTPTNPS